MATYIELVKEARLLVGMQGTGPSSVETVQGAELTLTRFVRDAYVDIQNMRDSWNFLERSQLFNTAIGVEEYPYLSIFNTPNPNLRKYQLDSFRVADLNGRKSYLRYIDRDVYESRYLNSTSTGIPSIFTIDPPTNTLSLRSIPDNIYSISFRYQRTPEILSADADVPALPQQFHNLIAYKAVEKMATYLSSPETYREYSMETSKMMGQLMRQELPKMRMRAGSLT